VDELAGKEFTAGVHSIPFDAGRLASGIYFYTLKAKDSEFFETKKMVIIR